jgi:hypothetical protein
MLSTSSAFGGRDLYLAIAFTGAGSLLFLISIAFGVKGWRERSKVVAS